MYVDILNRIDTNNEISYLPCTTTTICCICHGGTKRRNKQKREKGYTPIPTHLRHDCLFKWKVIVPNTTVVCKHCMRHEELASLIGPGGHSLRFLALVWDDVKKYDLEKDKIDKKFLNDLIHLQNRLNRKEIELERQIKDFQEKLKDYQDLEDYRKGNKWNSHHRKLKDKFKKEGFDQIQEHYVHQQLLTDLLEDTITQSGHFDSNSKSITNKYKNFIRWDKLTNQDCYILSGLKKRHILVHAIICNKNQKDVQVLAEEIFWLRCRMRHYFTWELMSVLFGYSDTKIREAVHKILPIYEREYAKRYLVNVRYKNPYWTRGRIRKHTPQFAKELCDIPINDEPRHPIILTQDGTYQYTQTIQSNHFIRKSMNNRHKHHSLVKIHIIATAEGRPVHAMPFCSDGNHSDGKIFECCFDEKYIQGCYNNLMKNSKLPTIQEGKILKGSDFIRIIPNSDPILKKTILKELPNNRKLKKQLKSTDDWILDDDIVNDNINDYIIDPDLVMEKDEDRNFWAYHNPHLKFFRNGFKLHENAVMNNTTYYCEACLKKIPKDDTPTMCEICNKTAYCNDLCRSTFEQRHQQYCGFKKKYTKLQKKLARNKKFFTAFNPCNFETLLEIKELQRLIRWHDHMISDNGYLGDDPRLKRPSTAPKNDKLNQTVQECNWKRGITAVRQTQERLHAWCKRNSMLRGKVRCSDISKMGRYWNIALADVNFFDIKLMKDNTQASILTAKITDLRRVDMTPIMKYCGPWKSVKCTVKSQELKNWEKAQKLLKAEKKAAKKAAKKINIEDDESDSDSDNENDNDNDDSDTDDNDNDVELVDLDGVDNNIEDSDSDESDSDSDDSDSDNSDSDESDSYSDDSDSDDDAKLDTIMELLNSQKTEKQQQSHSERQRLTAAQTEKRNKKMIKALKDHYFGDPQVGDCVEKFENKYPWKETVEDWRTPLDYNDAGFEIVACGRKNIFNWIKNNQDEIFGHCKQDFLNSKNIEDLIGKKYQNQLSLSYLKRLDENNYYGKVKHSESEFKLCRHKNKKNVLLFQAIKSKFNSTKEYNVVISFEELNLYQKSLLKYDIQDKHLTMDQLVKKHTEIKELLKEQSDLELSDLEEKLKLNDINIPEGESQKTSTNHWYRYLKAKDDESNEDSENVKVSDFLHKIYPFQISKLRQRRQWVYSKSNKSNIYKIKYGIKKKTTKSDLIDWVIEKQWNLEFDGVIVNEKSKLNKIKKADIKKAYKSQILPKLKQEHILDESVEELLKQTDEIQACWAYRYGLLKLWLDLIYLPYLEEQDPSKLFYVQKRIRRWAKQHRLPIWPVWKTRVEMANNTEKLPNDQLKWEKQLQMVNTLWGQFKKLTQLSRTYAKFFKCDSNGNTRFSDSKWLMKTILEKYHKNPIQYQLNYQKYALPESAMYMRDHHENSQPKLWHDISFDLWQTPLSRIQIGCSCRSGEQLPSFCAHCGTVLWLLYYAISPTETLDSIFEICKRDKEIQQYLINLVPHANYEHRRKQLFANVKGHGNICKCKDATKTQPTIYCNVCNVNYHPQCIGQTWTDLLQMFMTHSNYRCPSCVHKGNFIFDFPWVKDNLEYAKEQQSEESNI